MAGPRPAQNLLGAAGLMPVVVSMGLAMLMLLPLGSGLADYATPHLVMISCFYWLSWRPLLMPYGACTVLGLVLDLWLGAPLGINTIMLLLTRLFVLNQLKYYKDKNRGVYWGVFSVMAFGFFTLSWLLTSAVAGQFLAADTVFLQWLVTSFFYAPIAFVLGRLRRWVL